MQDVNQVLPIPLNTLLFSRDRGLTNRGTLINTDIVVHAPCFHLPFDSAKLRIVCERARYLGE